MALTNRTFLTLTPSSAFYLVLMVLNVFISCESHQIEKPESLFISENFENPTGFYDATPTFSWKLPVAPRIKHQSAYQVIAASKAELLPDNADLWDSGKQISNASIHINYKGEKLNSRQKVYWQVRFWNQDDGVSQWSSVSTFELGLLNNANWKAKWAGLPTAKDSIRGVRNFLMHRPQYLRKGFDISSEVAAAKLYITAKGIFDAHLNGKNISDDVMPPGWTPYNKRIETITYDVSEFLETGKNTLAVELASGWHSGRISRGKAKYDNFASPKILCQLEITLKDGSKQLILSDESWKGSTNGPIRLAGIYDGETYDAHLEMPGWTTNSFDDGSWKSLEVAPLDAGVRLEPKRHHTVKQKIVLDAQEIVSSTDSSAIFNFKQNMVGVPLLAVPMKKGDTLTVRFSEMLDPDGTFYTENYRSAHSTDYYIASEDKTISWSPKFTFHGFQYIELSGYDTSKEPSLDWIKGGVQHSNFKTQGSFSSSHDKLNQLQNNIQWGLRGNFFDVPTDCPQRDERLGWTGDAQVIAPTSIFNADVHSFWAAWLQSMRETQTEHENGLIPWIIPDVLQNIKAGSGWGDAAVMIPWEIYMATGDLSVLEENYDMAKKWVGYYESLSESYIPKIHSFGDWLQPYPSRKGKEGNSGDTSKEFINAAYFAHSAHLTSKIAALLGEREDVENYKDLYTTIALAVENTFFDENGRFKGEKQTQTAYLLAIHFNLLKKDKKEKAQQHLLEEIKKADYHLGTGFLGTPILPKVLDDMGEVDLMYKILFKETYPSWFHSINQGATTMWERWNSYSSTDGYNSQRMNSLNHYAYGAIGEWMYERIAGISAVSPGYKKIRIAPQPGTPLNAASGTLETPYGKVASAWKIDNDSFYINITIPPNTTAQVILPGDGSEDLLLNESMLNENEHIKHIHTDANSFEIEVQPGTYAFQTKTNH